MKKMFNDFLIGKWKWKWNLCVIKAYLTQDMDFEYVVEAIIILN